MQEFFNLKVTPYSPRNNNLLRLPKANTSRYRTQPLPLDETHLVVVRGLIHHEVSTKVRQRGELN